MKRRNRSLLQIPENYSSQEADRPLMAPHQRSRAKRGWRFLTALVFLAVAGLVACLPVSMNPPTATPLPTDTPSPTKTIVWFPPSATPTLITLPTLTATPDMNPGIGGILLEDDFSDDEVWDSAESENSNATISRNRLTLTVQPGFYISSMRRELPLTDFYAEITARPSLCRGEDNYGLIVRGVGSFFYRFVLTCNGQVRAERISGGTKLTIYEPVPSGDAPPAPGGNARPPPPA